MGVRDITGKSGKSEVRALGQNNRSLETLQPLVLLFGLQLDQEPRFGLDICQPTFCWDFSASELFLFISIL